MEQLLLTQACPPGHGWLQAPQFSGSDLTSVHTRFRFWQSVVPLGQVHCRALQVSGQAMSQLPQWCGSFPRSVMCYKGSSARAFAIDGKQG